MFSFHFGWIPGQARKDTRGRHKGTRGRHKGTKAQRHKGTKEGRDKGRMDSWSSQEGHCVSVILAKLASAKLVPGKQGAESGEPS